MKKIVLAIICGLIMVICFVNLALGFDDQVSHPAITKQAVNDNGCKLDGYLINNLGFRAGIKALMPSNSKYSILDLLTQGSTDEDDPSCRAVNHFHDPLKLWNESYLSDDNTLLANIVGAYCLSKGWLFTDRKSNITWATGFLTPPPDGQKATLTQNADRAPMTWDKAREYFYRALTGRGNTSREADFTKTFQAVGHVLHLLADVAVPAHVRNDFTSHLKFSEYVPKLEPERWFYNPFEFYVKRNKALVSQVTTPEYPLFSNPKVTDFWDTDQFTGSNPSTSLTIGLSEFTNANYLSNSTIPYTFRSNAHTYTYPKINLFGAGTNTSICVDYIEGTTRERAYICRKDKSPADHFAAISVWNPNSIGSLYSAVRNNDFSNLSGPLDLLTLDENVHKTYASEILPRAVGYSSGLLNYFFRGKIDITPPAQYVYSIIDGSKPQQFTKIKANLKNTTPNELMHSGTITAVAKYKKRIDYEPDLSGDPPDLDSMESDYSYSVSATQGLLPEQLASINANPTGFTFDFTQDPIPAGVTDLSLQVVFKGTLGNEKDNAIAVGFKDLIEPTHHVFWNLTDRFSIVAPGDTTWHLKTAGEIRADQNLLDRVNAPPPAYIDPYEINYEISYMGASSASAVPSASVTNLLPGNYIRLVVLVEKRSDTDDLYSSRVHYLKLKTTDPIDAGAEDSIMLVLGALNQSTPTPQGDIFYYTNVETFRTITQHFYTGMLRCRPFKMDSVTKTESCPYNDAEVTTPPDLAPTPAVITFE